ncbi:MAG: polysaccharide deacetylase family protein [Muribaculaceae bacterium]|nr:polysaccharide deacetylase family protein [Muribaculaceae bacterium]
MSYRIFFPEAIWRLKVNGRKVAYITFDDGPIPEVTPWLLDVLDSLGVKATFFMVGDNVRRHPELFEEIKRRGHSYGNHTMHHIRGYSTSMRTYLRDLDEADALIRSPLFRPPHGIIRWSQSLFIRSRYNLVMYDVVTRDYARNITPAEVLANVKRFTRDGSIIVFHDSLKSVDKLRVMLADAIRWLQDQGYELRTIPM